MQPKVLTVDPYLPHYVYQKSVDPSSKLYWRQYRSDVVQDVDKIIDLARGERDVVKGQKDWDIVTELVKFFANRWPDEFNVFKASIPDIRSSRRAGGYSTTKEIRYVGALPTRLIRLIKAIFPLQQFDKKFVNKLVQKYPLFKVGGESNLGKGQVVI